MTHYNILIQHANKGKSCTNHFTKHEWLPNEVGVHELPK